MTPNKRRILIDLLGIEELGHSQIKPMILGLIQKMITQRPDYVWTLLISSASKHELQAYFSDLQLDFRIWPKFLISFEQNILDVLNRLFYIPKSYYHRCSGLLQKFKMRRLAWHIADYDGLFCPCGAPNFKKKDLSSLAILHHQIALTYPFLFPYPDYVQAELQVRRFQYADTLISFSHYAKNSVIDQFKLEDRLLDVCSFADAGLRNRARQEASDCLKIYHLRKQEYFIYPAKCLSYNNHTMLLLAFSQAKHQGLCQDIQLILLIEDTANVQHKLRHYIQQLGLSSSVRILNSVLVDDAASLIKNSLAMIMASLDDVYPMVLLQALAYDLPIMCSDIEHYYEIIGDAACYFDPKLPDAMANAFIKMAHDASYRQHLIEKGSQRLEAYLNEDDMFKHIFNLIEKNHIAHGGKDEVINCDALI